MPDFSATAVFCEDIREEKGGLQSLIGVIVDNIAVPSVPGMIPKLCAYVRLHFLAGTKITSNFDMVLVDPAGGETVLGTIESTLVTKTMRENKKLGAPITGVFSNLVAAPFPVLQAGRFLLLLRWSTGEMTLAQLNFTVGPKP